MKLLFSLLATVGVSYGVSAQTGIGTTSPSPLTRHVAGMVPGNALFILAPSTPFDWRTPQNDNLWQGANGINNPCPSGWHVPTNSEWGAEAGLTDYNPLKLTYAGYRDSFGGNGGLIQVGSYCFYWSSTPAPGSSSTGSGAFQFYFNGVNAASTSYNYRGFGMSVRRRK